MKKKKTHAYRFRKDLILPNNLISSFLDRHEKFQLTQKLEKKKLEKDS